MYSGVLVIDLRVVFFIEGEEEYKGVVRWL